MGYEQGYPRLPAEIENTCFEISRPVGLASSSTESRGFCSSMAGAGIYSRTAWEAPMKDGGRGSDSTRSFTHLAGTRRDGAGVRCAKEYARVEVRARIKSMATPDFWQTCLANCWREFFPLICQNLWAWQIF